MLKSFWFLVKTGYFFVLIRVGQEFGFNVDGVVERISLLSEEARRLDVERLNRLRAQKEVVFRKLAEGERHLWDLRQEDSLNSYQIRSIEAVQGLLYRRLKSLNNKIDEIEKQLSEG